MGHRVDCLHSLASTHRDRDRRWCIRYYRNTGNHILSLPIGKEGNQYKLAQSGEIKGKLETGEGEREKRRKN